MRKVYLLFFLICLGQVYCKQKNTRVSGIENQVNETNPFFPVTQIIRGELAETDRLPVTPLKITIINGTQDSVWLKKADIRIFAEPFLHPEIDTLNIKQLYTGASFLDQTINAFTFTYDLKPGLPDTAELKSWNVYVDPLTNKIFRIYITKKRMVNTITQTIHLTWEFGQWCKITSITETPGKSPQIKEEKMIWDFNE